MAPFLKHTINWPPCFQESPERPALSQPSPPDAAPEEMEVPEPVQPTTPKGGTEIPKGGTEIPESS